MSLYRSTIEEIECGNVFTVGECKLWVMLGVERKNGIGNYSTINGCRSIRRKRRRSGKEGRGRKRNIGRSNNNTNRNRRRKEDEESLQSLQKKRKYC